MQSELAPGLLVAMPQLLDPNFHRSVVLMIHHDESGSFGVVLNRSTDVQAPELFAALDIRWRGDPEALLGWGGPVQPETGWVLFGEGQVGPLEDVRSVGEGICFAGTIEALKQLAEEPPEQLRLLLGYAGWGPGQLESELAQGAWLVAPTSPQVVFEVEIDEMWQHVLRSLGIDPATLVSSSGVH